MLRNYLAAAVRNFLRNGLYASTNVTGLALGFIAALLIALFVRNEYSYDRFFPDHERIYRISEMIRMPGRSPIYSNTTASDVGAALKREIPQVQMAVRLAWTRGVLVSNGREAVVTMRWADPDFFRLFPFTTLSGDLRGALSSPDGVVLTHTVAFQLFGRDTVIGERLQLDHEHVLRVTAVIADPPSNTHLNVQAVASGLAPFSRLATLDARAAEPGAPIKSEEVYTYVKLESGVAEESFGRAMRAFTDRYVQGEMNGVPVSRFWLFQLTPIARIHLQPGGAADMKTTVDPRTLEAMIAIAVVIVIAAVSNFAGMMTARAARRAVEVAVRKTVGATQSQLVFQFLGECLSYALAALALAVLAVDLIMPAFNQFLQRDMSFDYIRDPALGAALVSAGVMTGLAAGIYPALVMSRFRPGAVLKGIEGLSGGSARGRQLLVVMQFAALIALIVASLTVHRQARYALDERLHVPADQIYLAVSGCPLGIKEALGNVSGVLRAACASDSALTFGHIGTSVATHERGKVTFRMAPVGDADFFRSFGIEPLAGRLFEPDRTEDNLLRENIASSSNPSIVINETGARMLGYAAPSEAVGQFAIWGRIEPIDHRARGFEAVSSRIIGVVPDFSIGSVKEVIEPTLYYVDPSFGEDLILRLDGGAMARTMSAVETLWSQHSAAVPLQGRFLSEHVNELYADVVRQATLFTLFSVVAVVVAALGLLGLAVFTAQRRTREIGLRKVMGASRWDILCFLGREFTRPVLWANVIAWPVAWFFTRQWLKGFAYHVDNSLFVFVAASVLALIVAVGTVAGHAWLVAKTRPVEALRYE